MTAHADRLSAHNQITAQDMPSKFFAHRLVNPAISEDLARHIWKPSTC